MAIRFTLTHKRRIFILIFITFLASVYLLNKAKNQSPDLSDGSSSTNVKSHKRTGLTYEKRKLYLNGEEVYILSGALHYFRVLPEQWEDRLFKLKAAGLNTVETYVPWNLHEEVRGQFSFEGILNIRRFIKTAHKLGLYVIIRPGPYICAEWEFGGLPSWLLSDTNMKVRSMYFGFTKAVDEYFRQLLYEIFDLQYSRDGPIIAFQIENEYGTFGNNLQYMVYLKRIMEKYGIVERMFISNGDPGMLNVEYMKGVFIGSNFNTLHSGEELMNRFSSLDPDIPPFATEFWVGWFLRWGSMVSQSKSTKELTELTSNLMERKIHINFYMFHGGTNFGFMNGASEAGPVITSYDYDALLSESGQVTNRYLAVRRIIFKHMPPEYVAKVPEIPLNEPAHDYGMMSINGYLSLDDLLELIENPVTSTHLMWMEQLPINGDGGQGYGFIVYRSYIKMASRLHVQGDVRDRAIVLINHELVDPKRSSYGIIESKARQTHFDLNNARLYKNRSNTLDIIVENMGRINYAEYQTNTFNEQRKGLTGSVSYDEQEIKSWNIYPLEFKKPFLQKASSSDKWTHEGSHNKPGLYRGVLKVDATSQDTYIDTQGWTKGQIFVNGFNLGRYWSKGPQKRLYLPKNLLRPDRNEILIFELHQGSSSLNFVSQPLIDVPPVL